MKVFGCGSLDRGDDGAGILVARQLRAWGVDARERTDLVDAWERDDDVVIVDAMVSGRPVGTVVCWSAETLPSARAFRTSTHGLGVIDAVRLAEALGRRPKRLRVYGIEGACFDLGARVGPKVAAAIDRVAAAILSERSCEGNDPGTGPGRGRPRRRS